MKTFKQLLRLSILAVAAASSTTSISTSSPTIITKFFRWPIDSLSQITPPASSHPHGPLLSRKLFRTIYDKSPTEYNPDALFSFKLTGSAARRHAERQLNGVGSNFYDGPLPGDEMNGHDGHDAHDAHEMVVHVTYEDICEYCIDICTDLVIHCHAFFFVFTSHFHDTIAWSFALLIFSNSLLFIQSSFLVLPDSILVFLVVATGMGILTSKLGMPALVGEIITGFVLGPPLADFVPFPEAMVLVGEVGLIMLLLEAGVELDIAQLKETGTRAVAIGLTGTILPLLVGMGLATLTGASLKSAMAVGASFSPTSLGVAASALKAGKMADDKFCSFFAAPKKNQKRVNH